jgi:hypothetical protein
MNRFLFIFSSLSVLLLACNQPVEQDSSSLKEWPVTVYFTFDDGPQSPREELFSQFNLEISDNENSFRKIDSSFENFIMMNIPAGTARTFYACRRAAYYTYEDMSYYYGNLQLTHTCTTSVDIQKGFNTVTLNLTRIPPPVIFLNPVNCSLMYSDNARFYLIAGGFSLQYQWKKGNKTYAWSQNSFIEFPAKGSDSGSIITCTICNASGCVESAPAILSVTCDTVPPKIILLDTIVEVFLYGKHIDNGVFVYDSVDKILTNNIHRTGDVNTTVAGQYPIHYSVSDSCGNTATASRIVMVRPFTEPDSALPVIKLTGPDTVFGYIGYMNTKSYRDSGFQAYDKNNQDITEDVKVSDQRLIYDNLFYFEYNVTDKDGNQAVTRRRFFQSRSFDPLIDINVTRSNVIEIVPH